RIVSGMPAARARRHSLAGSDAGSDFLLIDQYFHPPIRAPAARGAVVRDRFGRPVGHHANLGGIDAFLADDVSGDARGAALSEFVVVVFSSHVVGMSRDNKDAPRARRGVVGSFE